MSQAARGRWLILGATFLWGTSATLARFLFRDLDVAPLVVVELRLAMSAAVLVAWLALRRPHLLAVAPREWPSLLLLGVVGVAMIQGSYYYAISVLGVGLAILIQYLAPILIVLYEILRGAKPGARTGLVALAALAGTGLLVGQVGPEAANARPVDWLISFSSAFTFAFYIVYSKRVLARHEPETVIVYTFVIAAAFWMVFVPPTEIARAGYSASTWLLFCVVAPTSALVPFSMFLAGLRRLPPTEVSILATVEPLVAVLSAWLALGEGLKWVQWVGAVLVLIAATLASTGRGLGMTPRVPVPSPDHAAGAD
jgi:drug/metabolite transporter (DMT)-like permease